ncbi:MAG: hypothetical protein HY763_03680 [Planctomycetes bacterium]|nr:hypothetical protein [Planctomycetota bacterium]
MSELISEPITPFAGTGDVTSMALGEPGLPAGFTWRGDAYAVVEVLRRWKQSSREGGWALGELYLRRHCYRVRMRRERPAQAATAERPVSLVPPAQDDRAMRSSASASDGSPIGDPGGEMLWSIYCLRQNPRGNARKRWFLYAIEPAG